MAIYAADEGGGMEQSVNNVRNLLKGPAEIKQAVCEYLARHQLEHVAGLSDAWPHRIALGRPTKAELAAHAAEISLSVDELTSWASGKPVHLEFAARKSGGATHDLPTHAVVETIDDAAALCGRAAVHALERDRMRAARLKEASKTAQTTRAAQGGLAPQAGQATRATRAAQAARGAQATPCSKNAIAKALKTTLEWECVDFDLLVDAVRWFCAHDAAGLTPRQVPLPGFSAKWLDAAGRRTLIEALCNKQIGLVSRARSIEFAYLDPAYLNGGGRRFDSWVEGDALALPYSPTRCFIVENKDTFRAFPPLEGSICVFGSGWAGVATVPVLPCLPDFEDIYYWGDIDADGFEILDAYRTAGVNAESLLMDLATYHAFEPYGTDISTGKASLASRAEKPLENLTEDERALYRLLVSPDCPGHRRIEQERIPFTALTAFVDYTMARGTE